LVLCSSGFFAPRRADFGACFCGGASAGGVGCISGGFFIADFGPDFNADFGGDTGSTTGALVGPFRADFIADLGACLGDVGGASLGGGTGSPASCGFGWLPPFKADFFGFGLPGESAPLSKGGTLRGFCGETSALPESS
jgi:hypothetical protein